MSVNILSLKPPGLSPTCGLEARAPGNFARFAHAGGDAGGPGKAEFLHKLLRGNDGVDAPSDGI